MMLFIRTFLCTRTYATPAAGLRTLCLAILCIGATYQPAAALDNASELDAVLPTAIEAYRFLHENPEIGKAEHKAHEYLVGKLTSFGGFALVPSTLAPTAVIGVLDTGRTGPVIALRAEMDARKLDSGVVEPSDHDPRSKIDGLMHNCGHDVHAAILLATAKFAATHRARLSGKIVFLFQPAEETAGGADDIVQEGILDQLGVEQIYALHSASKMPVDTIAISAGPALAGSNSFKLIIKGAGSHAAVPFEGDDVPMVATHFVQALGTWPARQIDLANRPVVVSVTKIVSQSGGQNILPETAEISGTVRAFEPVNEAPPGGASIASLLAERVEALAKAYGVTAEWTLTPGSPATLNHAILFRRILPPLQSEWPGTVDTRPWRGMFSEDFAYYTSKKPALYFSLGVAKGGRGEGSVHTKDFDVHPDSFMSGIRLMTSLADIATRGGASR